MREEELHLIGKNPSALEIDVLRISWRKRNRNQLHPGLLRCIATLVVIAPPAGRDNILPSICSTLTQGSNVIARQIPGHEPAAAIHAKACIALEQSLVIQGRYKAVSTFGATRSISNGRNNRINLDETAQARCRIDASMNPVQQRSACIGHLIVVIEPDRILIVDPLQRHARDIGSQNLL